MVSCAVLLKKALGRLVAAPLFTVFAVVSLSAGVAVTTAVYSVVDKLFLSDIGATAPESLAFVMTGSNGRLHRAGVADEDFDALRAAQRSFSSVAASLAFLAPITSTRNSEIVPIEAVSPSYFDTVGITAGRGRVFDAAESSGAAVVVLSDEFWRSRYAADETVVGRTVRIAGQVFEIIGIAPQQYHGLSDRAFSTMAWIPLASETLIRLDTSTDAQRNQRGRLVVAGRVKEGSSIESASVELQTLSRQLDASRPLTAGAAAAVNLPRSWSARSASDRSDEDDMMRRTGFVLVALVGMVLVVACTNLANLVLARGTARQGELAIRMAMGASRARLIWEQSIEGILLSIFGAAAAYAMFIAVSAMMTQDFALVLPPMGHITLAIRPVLNAQALAVAAGSMLLALAVFSLEPAVQLARSLDIRGTLAVGATGVRPRVGRQRMIMRWQVAVAAGFFIVATMFIRATFDQLRHDSGVDLDRIAVAALRFDRSWDEARIRRSVERIIEDSAHDRAIEVVSASTGLPFGVSPALQVGLTRDGDEVQAEGNGALAAAIAGTPSLFRALGITLVRGRGFNDGDAAGAPPVIVLSEFTARQVFGTADSIGRSLMLRRGPEPQRVTVVGIARDTDVRSLNGPPRPLAYLPLQQHFDRTITLAARAASDSGDAVAALREAIQRADADLGVDVIGRGRTVLSGPFEIARSAGMGTLYLGVFTLLLSMAGLFGVQSHVVAYRTREFGVRMSLGATARQIKLMVVRDGARPVLEGLVLGLWGGIAMRLIIRSYTDLDVAVFDAWMLLVAPVPIVLAALCACYLPASKASRVDPTTALRCE
jgi:predicted permease